MYIIDNDGLANSDKRFPTKLRNKMNGWLHDEISGWVSTEGEEKEGILEKAWLQLDDSVTNGTKWTSEKGEKKVMRKACFLDISKIEIRYYTLLPEYYMRPFTPNYVTQEEFEKSIKEIENNVKALTV